MPRPGHAAGARWLLSSAYHVGGFVPPALETLDTAGRMAGLARLIGIIVALFVLGALATGMTFFAMAWAGQHVLRALRIDVFERLHQLSLSFYAGTEAGDLMSRITNDTSAIEQAISFALVNVVSAVLGLTWVAYYMISASPALALLSLAVTPLMFLATLYFSSQARKAFRRSRREIGNVNAELQESIAAVREVQAFARADENIEQFKEVNAANRDANVRAVTFTSALSPTLEALGYVGLAIVAGVGGLYLLRGAAAVGHHDHIRPGGDLPRLRPALQPAHPADRGACGPTSRTPSRALSASSACWTRRRPCRIDPVQRDLPRIVGQVEFDHVSHHYEDGVPVLQDVSFTAEPGQTIAIVGPTGAGKTTIINLLPRFYDVAEGVIRIDGIDVRDVKLESIRRQVGIVLQDTFLFSTTVMENVRFGRPDASDDEVKAAIRLANADSFVERLPEKYDTVLGERGSGLSQGQRQLLSIARAALADPRILILDEATSSVDTRTERLIQKAFDELLKGRTSIVIAHRLSTIINADQILVLVDGRIVERGRHAELMAEGRLLLRLVHESIPEASRVRAGRRQVDRAGILPE